MECMVGKSGWNLESSSGLNSNQILSHADKATRFSCNVRYLADEHS